VPAADVTFKGALLTAGMHVSATIDGSQYSACSVIQVVAAADGTPRAVVVGLKKRVRVARALGWVELTELIDSFNRTRALRNVLIAPRSAHQHRGECGCVLGSKSAEALEARQVALEESTQFQEQLRRRAGIVIPPE
jgi:hypothetical protein